MATTKKTTTKKKATKKEPEVKRAWKVDGIPVAGTMLFSAYKLRDENGLDEDGNRIYKGGLWQTFAEAQKLADNYNKSGKY